jgi:hypothetical protein
MSTTGKEIAEALGLVSKKFACEICGEEHDSEQEALNCVVSCVEG